MDISKIELVTIDFWNTLFTGSPVNFDDKEQVVPLFNALSTHGVTMTASLFKEVLTASWKYYKHCWEDTLRTPSSSEIINKVWEELQLPVNATAKQIVIDFVENSLLHFPPVVEQRANETLAKLKCRYKLALISDTGFSTGRIVNKFLGQNEMLHYFDAFSYSDETGVAKPHKKAFHHVCGLLNVKPENSLHIGDIERTDIAGAKSAGMFAIRYDGSIDTFSVSNRTEKSQADAIVSSWTEIAEILLKE